jgi:hypothetical protein
MSDPMNRIKVSECDPEFLNIFLGQHRTDIESIGNVGRTMQNAGKAANHHKIQARVSESLEE